MKKIFVSACLNGSPVRYDGRGAQLDDEILQRWIEDGVALFACPEMLGGLPTPRPPAEIVGVGGDAVLRGEARVVTVDGDDVTKAFERGAKAALKMALDSGVVAALMQERSPSCGTSHIYDGSFTKQKVSGVGVTSALFRRHGIRVFKRSEIQLADQFLRGETLDAKEILDFWFDGDSKKWFTKNLEFDATVKEKFGATIQAASSGKLDDWRNDPDSCLAAILLLDQFTRNAYRGTAAMFASDEKARGFAKVAIARGFDLKYEKDKRTFFYMPLEHSEHHDDQEMSIALFERLHEESDGGADILVDYAQKHKAIIDRFGRYPHRNEILGRETTPAEAEFLSGPNSSF